ncbi:uncharacterized protein [Parasteatoda tepidariorum]|uniref:uncharacterized protein n=1 Tax=Parasteatoda tepidariorum TaxID=114398 RepID=UPI00077FCF18|nr:uncharacterized protein LOC107449850 [Parasteatoda tepidariorum]
MILLFLSIVVWKECSALPLVPTAGTCNDTFITVFPPKIMNNWHVITHTDSIPPSFPHCILMKIGRRITFNTELRIDIINTIQADEAELTLPPIRGEMTVKALEPFGVFFPLSPIFPHNIQITDFDESCGCMAFWSCEQVMPSMSIRGAWVACQSTDVDEDCIEKLKGNVANASNIPTDLFIKTKYEKCF